LPVETSFHLLVEANIHLPVETGGPWHQWATLLWQKEK